MTGKVLFWIIISTSVCSNNFILEWNYKVNVCSLYNYLKGFRRWIFYKIGMETPMHRQHTAVAGNKALILMMIIINDWLWYVFYVHEVQTANVGGFDLFCLHLLLCSQSHQSESKLILCLNSFRCFNKANIKAEINESQWTVIKFSIYKIILKCNLWALGSIIIRVRQQQQQQSGCKAFWN